ncbi:MAG: RICIN domain-containing protein [Bacteroidetes bacterium]|nr:RICIN domain-containing protein [Bacteroidota bacterium]
MKKFSILIPVLPAILSLGCAKGLVSKSSLPVATPSTAMTSLGAPAGSGAVGDPNIKYFGRWDTTNAAQYVSYWGGAYIRVSFTGTTVKIKVGVTTNYYVKIDNGPWVSYIGVTGTVNLTPAPLTAGTHTLSVAQGKDYSYVFNFQGLILDPGAATSAPPVGTDLVEWIGDSITSGYTDDQADVSDYAWIASEALGTEHTQIAYPGIALVSGYGVNSNKTGMDVQYFKLQSLAYTSSPDWNFARYTPKVVVINLGTNDNNSHAPDSTFQRVYTTFLANVRAEFPNAEILVLRTFAGVKAVPTAAAVTARHGAGDSKVLYIDTNGWLTPGSSDFTDGTHPSDSGHMKVAARLQPIIAPYLTGGAPSVANGTYKIVCRNDGLVLDAKGKDTVNGTPIQQWGYSGGTNQKWTVTSLGGNIYKIIGVQSGRSIDVTGNVTTEAAAIELYDYHSGTGQQWSITPSGGGYYTITSVRSGLVLDVTGNVTTPGALLQQWHSTGGNNQQWAFQTP